MKQIACKECTSPDCHGCNMYRLERMLMSGKLDALMNENRAIKMDADVQPVVLCRDCKNYIERSGACAFLVVGMREDDFCSYGKKREES